ncbi:hypothetical protein [Brevibacillus agri]|uniref:hypothetical protein n=1 Tax=Brevibacillus agri TaxID=51101 RepID=UPI002867CA9F|nr:hypothetical protein [Brevibacillus agri]
MQIGDKVKWASQANGIWKEKRGVLRAILGPDDDVYDVLPPGLPKSRFKGSRRSLNRRALVEVPRGGKSKLSDFYAPYLSVLEKIGGEHE